MNLLTLTDHKLSNLRHRVAQELHRRSKAAIEGLDSAAIIYSNEVAKRALIVAAAGGHSILFLGPSNSGKTMLRAVALELGLAEAFEARPCPCGNRNDPRVNCNCTVRQIERHMARLPLADITVEMQRPSHREMGRPGTSVADMRKQIEAKSGQASTVLGTVEAGLLRAATVELSLDPAVLEVILAIARTIANLDWCDEIECSHLVEAINYRPLWRR